MSGIGSSSVSGAEFARQVKTIIPNLEQSKQAEFVSSLNSGIADLHEVSNENKGEFFNTVKEKYVQAGGNAGDLEPLQALLNGGGLADDFKTSFLGEINTSRASAVSDSVQQLPAMSQQSAAAAGSAAASVSQNPDESGIPLDVKKSFSRAPLSKSRFAPPPPPFPIAIDSAYSNNVAMGAYAITDPTKDKCIKTIGLGPCVCIFMRDESGKSLLAHLDASDDKPRTINALKEAFRQAGGDPERSSVTIAGGNDATDSSREFIDAIKGSFRGDQINPISDRVTLGSTPRDVIFSVENGDFGLITNPLKPADAENPADKGYLPPSGTPFPRYGAA